MKHFSKLAQIYSSVFCTTVLPSTRQVGVATMATIAQSAQDVFLPPICTLTDEKCTLDRDLFTKTVKLPAVHFNKKLTSACMKALKTKAVPRKNFAILRDSHSDPDEKYLLLNPDTVSSENVASLGEPGISFVRENNLGDKLGDLQVTLEYSDWTCEEILRSLLPAGVEVPTGFSRIGHIAHLNLRPEQLKYKHIIGEVFMDKNRGLRTVVNKTGEISNEFRFFNMELLAGENDMVTTTKEHGHSFEFDFSKVYWNPRLSTEHTRIVAMLNKGDVVYDVFAGVGPFAVPAAKKGCVVLANDLNPESYKWLDHNVRLNKIKPGLIRTYNMDGREFIKKIVKRDLIKRAEEKSDDGDCHIGSHVVMNLPSLAIEFLDVFSGLLREVPSEVRGRILLPTIHCHCFSKEADPAGDVQQRLETVLNHGIKGALIHDVRDVAPNKEMMCASFQIPAAAAFGDNAEGSQAAMDEPKAKRSRTE